jgi:hypothetical protein
MTDRLGNEIGTAADTADYFVYEFDNANINSSVNISETTESVYVRYSNSENGRSITCRFSNHICNAVAFGDQLDGNFASKAEVLFNLGIGERVFVPNTYLSITSRMVKKSQVAAYDMADITIKEMYALGANADISQYTGKVAKDSQYLILGTTVEKMIERKLNMFGDTVQVGKYIYK